MDKRKIEKMKKINNKSILCLKFLILKIRKKKIYK